MAKKHAALTVYCHYEEITHTLVLLVISLYEGFSSHLGGVL